jgi:hypothetical protein
LSQKGFLKKFGLLTAIGLKKKPEWSYMKINKLAILLLAVCSSHGSANNLETHAEMTRIAFSRSEIVRNPDLLKRLGIDRLEPRFPFINGNSEVCSGISRLNLFRSHGYLDALPNWNELNFVTVDDPTGRCPTLFEQRSMPPQYSGLISNPSLGPLAQLRLEAWLMRGVIREDDFQSGKYDNPNLFPDRDPWNDDFRSKNHFYNPVRNDTGLGPLGNNFQRSTTWALGISDSDAWLSDDTPDTTRGNHFSYMDARRQYFLALTFKDRTNTSRGPLDEYRLRTNLWASLFKSLGHVVHLLQDTASPQHVRGEPHSLLCNGGFIDDAFEASVATRTYENFSNYRVTFRFDRVLEQAGVTARYSFSNFCDDEKWRRMFDAGNQQEPRNITAWEQDNTYPTPQFSVQRKFFTTRLEDAALNARRGLADYTNRGFFTEGAFEASLGLPNPDLPSPPPVNDPSYAPGTTQTVAVPGLGSVSAQTLFWRVPDAISPNYPDPNIDASGRTPVVSRSLWNDVYVIDGVNIPIQGTGGNLTLENYTQISDMLPPRAIAYTTGMLNFFFRGKLEIEPLAERMFGVVDMGQPHTMTQDGYPIVTATNKVLGFEKIRLKVRNVTPPIVESGTNEVVNQISGSGKLVAVARYHRNPCYKPDLSGERVQSFALPPQLIITEPTCPDGVRTNYQEISVSAPMMITSIAELPGGTNTPLASVEKTFDFSADPIPVNATDLFIQVVYRGQLGQETDGIAVGTFDVQEPTFYAAWNNTDYFFSEPLFQWLTPNATFPARVIQGIRVCAGFPTSKWVYAYNTSNPQPGLPFFLGNASPGVVRLGFMFAKPATSTQRYAIRAQPVMLVAPSAPIRSTFTRGQERQASRELFDSASPLPAPSFCQLIPPVAGSTFWCFDPIQRRRGQRFGDAIQPLFYSQGTSLTDIPDVDAAPAQPVFPGQVVRAGGDNKFNDTVLADCPPAPMLSPQEQADIELREEAGSLGIDLTRQL